MKQSEYERNIWIVDLEGGVPFEAVFDPGFWAHVSAKLKPWDHLEVRTDDGTFWAELIVRDAGKLYAKVAVLNHVSFDDSVEVQQLSGVKEFENVIIKWRGPHFKWCVLRGTDVLKEGFAIKGEAYTWRDQHLRAA